MLRGSVILIVYLGSLFVIFFLSAGRIDLPMAWVALGSYGLTSLLALLLADPELVQERSHQRAGIRSTDRLLASLSFFFFYPLTLLVGGLDVGRLGRSPPVPFAVQGLALILFMVGNGVGCWAVVSNKYFSTFVRIQTDRYHRVVTAGPYRYVRHPGYAGTILAALVLPLALGSLWALLPALIGVCGFVVRTVLEDQTLIEELEGYREYASRVRYRLVPGIW